MGVTKARRTSGKKPAGRKIGRLRASAGEPKRGLVDEIVALGRRAIPLAMDVMDLDASRAAIDRVVREGAAPGRSLRLRMTLTSEGAPSLRHVVETTITLD